MPDLHTDETLEAVALVLRDLKTEFEGRLKTATDARSLQEDRIFGQLTELSQSVSTKLASMTAYRKEVEELAEEMRQRIDVITDRLQDDLASRLTSIRQQFDELREVDKTLRASIQVVMEGVATVDRSSVEAKGEIENIRVRHQTVQAQLVEFDKHVVTQEELRELRINVIQKLDDAGEKVGVELSVLGKKLEELQELDSETRDLFEKIGAQCKALALEHENYQQKIAEDLETVVRKSDLDAVQELLVETSDKIEEVRSLSKTESTENQQSLERFRDQFQETVERDRNASAARLQEVHDKLAGLRAKIVQGLEAELREMIEARAKISDQMLVGQAEQIIGKLSENIKGDRGPTGYLSRVQRWVEDYEFPELSLVRHGAGLWQALRNTAEEPRSGSSSDWLLIAAGIDSVTTVPNETVAGSYALRLKDSGGKEHVIEIQLPMPRFHKTWEEKRRYAYYDSVMEEGHRWLAIKDDPTGPPSRSEDWILIGMRGARGARGVKGDPGTPGPSPDMQEVLDAYVQRLVARKGVPISSYRGSWRYGADYSIGDFVRGDSVMALCQEDHRAEKPPSTTAGQQQWEILFELPESGSDLSGPPHQDLYTQIQRQENQIAALTAQVEKLSADSSSS